MLTNKITVGTKISYLDRDFVVEDIIPPNLYLRRFGDNALIKAAITDVQNFGRIIYDTDYCVENMKPKGWFPLLSEKERNIIEKRFEYIKPIIDYHHFKSIGDLDCLIEKYPWLFPESFNVSVLTQEKVIAAIVRVNKGIISSRTIKRYLRAYKGYERKGLDGKLGLRPKTGERVKKRKDNKQLVIFRPNRKGEISDVIDVRIPAEQATILAEKISKHYLNIKGCSIAELIDIVNVECFKKGLEPIKASTVYGILSRYNKAEQIRFRGSSREVLNKVTSIKRGYTNENGRYPLHFVAIDHHKLDVLIVDDFGRVIGRAWITIGIDYYSRMIWGCHIGFNEPSINKVIKLFKHGLLPKNPKAEFGTQNDYPICGKPDFIYFDNASEFRSDEIEYIVTNVIGATIEHRPVDTPHYAAAVERFFETLNTECIWRLSGTTKSNPQVLGDYEPEKFARYTLPELKKIIFTYIVDIYHVSLHRGLKTAKTPLEAYYKGITAHGIPNYIAPEEEGVLRFNLMRRDQRCYRGDGLTFDNIRYKSDEADALIIPGEKYTFLYDDDDISFIRIKHPRKEDSWLVVPAVEPKRESIAGMNRYYYKWLLKMMDDGEKVNDNNLLEAKMRLQNLINKQYNRSSLLRKKAQLANLQTIDIDTHHEPPKDEVLAMLDAAIKQEKEANTDVG